MSWYQIGCRQGVAAVIVIGWRIRWDIDQAQVRIRRQWCPRRDVTRIAIGICLPGVIPKLTFLRRTLNRQSGGQFLPYPRTCPEYFLFEPGHWPVVIEH